MLPIAFFALLVAVVGAIIMALYNMSVVIYEDYTKVRRFKKRSVLFFIAWVSWILVLCYTTIFNNFSFPPHIPILLVLPAFIIIIILLANKNIQALTVAVPANWPIYFQSFRIIVELLLFGLFVKEIVPKQVTLEGRNFDIFIGITAPIMGLLISRYKSPSIYGLALLWNIVGLLLLANAIYLINVAAYFPQKWGADTSLIKPEYYMMPIALLAGLFMPVAVFMHIFSIIQMRRLLKNPKSL